MKKGSLFQRLAAAPHILWAIMFIVLPMIFVLFFAGMNILLFRSKIFKKKAKK